MIKLKVFYNVVFLFRLLTSENILIICNLSVHVFMTLHSIHFFVVAYIIMLIIQMIIQMLFSSLNGWII